MNILILTVSFPPRINSAAHLYYDLSLDLIKKGHSVTVVTEYPGGSGDLAGSRKSCNFEVFGAEIMSGVQVVRVPLLGFMGKLPGGKALRYLLSCILFVIGSLYVRKRIDAILVYSPPLFTGISAYIISKLRRCPFIFNIQDIHPNVLIDMGYIKNKFVIALLTWMEGFIYRKAHAIICYSKGNAKYLEKRGVNFQKIAIIPNWVHINSIKPGNKLNQFRTMHKLKDKFIVSYAGTMGQSQGMEVIIEAAENLRSYSNINFLLVGEGDFKSALQKSAIERNLNNVIFMPLQPKEVYAEILMASDVCLLTLSKNLPQEEVPGKLANLMASGRPIVAIVNPKGDAAKLIIDAACGYCIEYGDSKAISETILNLLNKEDLADRMGKMGRLYAEHNFSRKLSANQYEKILVLATINKKPNRKLF